MLGLLAVRILGFAEMSRQERNKGSPLWMLAWLGIFIASVFYVREQAGSLPSVWFDFRLIGPD